MADEQTLDYEVNIMSQINVACHIHDFLCTLLALDCKFYPTV